MNSGFTKVIAGQLLLVVCCVFYTIWWSISYKPEVEVSRAGGINGALLLVTAASGITGLVLSIYGANDLPVLRPPKLNGGWIVACGIVLYVLFMIVTRLVFDRPVTTELFLITGWAVLELTVINALNAAGKVSDLQFWIIFSVVVAAFVTSMVLYVLYYKMEPMKAYYAAMVPLATEGISMAILSAMALL